MVQQYVWIALGLVALYFAYNYLRSRSAAAVLIQGAEPLRTLTPKTPSSADAFSATEVIVARLKAVGLPAEEIAAIRRPILEQISKEVL